MDMESAKHKLTAFREACRPHSLYLRLKKCDLHLYAVTLWACLAFVGLGASVLVFGPTLLDLADHLGVGVDILAIMFTCRAIGGAVGSVMSGIIMDRLVRYSYTILCVIYVSCIATTAVIPLSTHIAMLGVFMTLSGVAVGCVDNGTHAVLIKLWRDKAGPCMQILHFCFAFGTFVAPLVAKQFISDPSEQAVNVTNVSLGCGEVLNSTLSVEQKIDSLMLDEISMNNLTECFLKINNTCSSLPMDSPLTVTDNCTIEFKDNSFPTYSWAYWIASTFYIPSLIAFIYFAATKELSQKCCRKKQFVVTEGDESTSDKEKKDDKTNKQAFWFIAVMFALLFVFLFFYVGLEVAYGSLIFTVAVTGEVNFTKSDAAILTSLFWGTFAFVRLFSVLLAMLKVRSSVMMAGNLSGSFLAGLILVFYPHDPTAVWIGSGVLGASYASIYPTTMTWMSENTVATGKATSVLVAAGTLGDISIPSITGVIISRVSPDMLLYITFGGVLISAAVVAVLFLVTCLYNRKYKKKLKHSRTRRRAESEVVRYKKLEEKTEEEVSEQIDIIHENGDFPSTQEDTNFLEITR